MDIKQQILTALGIDKKILLEWQAKLTDGTIVVSPDVELTGGSEVNILVEDGSQMPLPAGSYETEDGVGFVVAEGADGIVAELLTEEVEAPTEEEVVVEAAEDDGEADIADWKGLEKRVQQIEDAIADLKADKEGGDDEVETEDGNEEEMSTPAPAPKGPKTIKKTEVTEFTALKKENKKLAKEIEALKKAAGAEGIKLNRFTTTNKSRVEKLSKADYNNLNAKEKFAYDLYRN